MGSFALLDRPRWPQRGHPLLEPFAREVVGSIPPLHGLSLPTNCLGDVMEGPKSLSEMNLSLDPILLDLPAALASSRFEESNDGG